MNAGKTRWGFWLVPLGLLWSISASALDVKQAYLPLSDELAAQLSKQFGISLSRGLYYSDPWQAKLVPELRDKRFFNNSVPIELGDANSLMRMLRYPGNQLPINGRAGFIDTTDTRGKGVRQLWLVSDRNQKWMLYEVDREDPSTPRLSRVMNLPTFFMTVPNGLIAVTSTGELFYKIRGEETGISNFQVTDLKSKTSVRKLNVALGRSTVPAEFKLDKEEEEVPVMTYNPSAKALLMAVRPIANEIVEPGVLMSRDVQIALLDLNPASRGWKKAKLIDPEEIRKDEDANKDPSVLPWPLFLDRRGVFYSDRKQITLDHLRHKPFDWGTNRLGPSRPMGRKEDSELEVTLNGGELSVFRRIGKNREFYAISSDGKPLPLARPTGTFAELKPENLAELSGLGGARDILGELRTGAWEPDYYDTSVSDSLARELDGGAKTWIVVVYENGQSPLSTIGSFFWGVDTQLIPTSRKLSRLQSVLVYSSEALVKGKNEADVRQDFVTLKDGVDGANAVLVFEDLPTNDVAQGLSPANQTRFQTFGQIFGPCSLQRTCRVITTLKREIYDGLQKQTPGIFDGAQVMVLPKAPLEMSKQLLRLAVGDCEIKRGMPCSPAALRAFSDWVARAPTLPGMPTGSPGREVAFAERLFNAASSEGGNDPSARLAEIDIGFVRRFTTGDSAGVTANPTQEIDVEAMRAYVKKRTAGRKHKEIVDQICDRIAAIKTGAVARDTPHRFILIGPSAVGKSHIAKLISGYLAGGETGEPIVFDMRQYKSTAFKIDPQSPQAQQFKDNRRLKAVIFDDIHEASRASLTTLTQVFESGIYSAGSENQIDFRNSLLFWTTTWGDDLLKQEDLNDGDFELKIVDFLKNSPQGPQIRDEDWTRMRAHIYRLPLLKSWELVEVGLMQAREARERFRRDGRDLLIHPTVITYNVGLEKSVGGQARTIRDGVVKAVETLTSKIRPEGSQRFIVRHSAAGGYVGQSEGDSKKFEEDWERLLELYQKYDSDGLEAVLETWYPELFKQKLQQEKDNEQ